jgi:hypothetical protein
MPMPTAVRSTNTVSKMSLQGLRHLVLVLLTDEGMWNLGHISNHHKNSAKAERGMY